MLIYFNNQVILECFVYLLARGGLHFFVSLVNTNAFGFLLRFCSIERLRMSEGEVKKISRQDIQLVSQYLKIFDLCTVCINHLNGETWIAWII